MKLNKLAGLALAASLALGFALPVGAATFSNVAFDNGDVTISGQGGSTVNATFRVVVPANQVVERIQTDVLSDNLAPVCTEVGGDKGLEEGTHNVTLPIKLPPNTGTYTLAVQGSGIFGGFRTVDCVNDVVGTASFSSSLRVVSNSDSSTGGTTGGSESALDKLTVAIAALISSIKGTGGTANPVCAELLQYSSGLSIGSTGPRVVSLQGFLLAKNPDSIPLIRDGVAKFGFFGAQTGAAVSAYGCVAGK